MNYTIFKNISEVPSGFANTIVIITKGEDNDSIMIAKKRKGKKFGKEAVYKNLSQVFTDPFGGISSDSEVYVQEDAETIFEVLLAYSKLFRKYNGNFDSIAKDDRS